MTRHAPAILRQKARCQPVARSVLFCTSMQVFSDHRTFAASIRFGLAAVPFLIVLVACSSGKTVGADADDAGNASDAAVQSGGSCRTATECGLGQQCYLPGRVNCGVAPRDVCVLGAACTPGQFMPGPPPAADGGGDADAGGDAGAPDGVCLPPAGCDGTRCVPRCKDDSNCGGSAAGHCKVESGVCGPPLCTSDAACNSANLVCSTAAVRTCVPKPCSADADCDGFCSNGTCSALGTCQSPAP